MMAVCRKAAENVYREYIKSGKKTEGYPWQTCWPQ